MVELRTVTPTPGYKLGVIGTSLCHHNDFASTSFNKISHSSRGWMSWARFYSQGLFTCPVWWDNTVYEGWEPTGAGTTRFFQGLNAGVFGQTAEEIYARREFLTKNIDCDIIVVDAGTNDYETRTKEQIQQTREDLVNYFLSFGKLVILLPILARSTTVWPGGGVTRARMNWINHKSREFCAGRKG
ncbi:hypothetical protein AU106_gp066 [Sinorhizobium phage phiM9]|uniref:Uncharacterized protein n=1 Tax=Sinorhizobium phage phiM9 TaxID=1636182 RepID=A0A0F6R4X0_9CAUD|nr:hypothetical protein AU106_gp066 [Sinorhizobium phage phiM9]AKE44697.1 hypothetical protein Sm_phiM9_067 [Sinorhizobium phage phiM9]